MSLYNQLFGTWPHARILMNVLGISPEKAGRVRDVYVSRNSDGRFVIVLFTRNGGGNRDCWGFEGCKDGKHDDLCMVSIIANLKAHPLYIKDYDVPEDPTYASFEFKVPANKIELVEHIYSMTKDKRSPMDKFNDLITKIEKGETSDPEVANALNVGKSIIDRVTETLNEKPKRKRRKKE